MANPPTVANPPAAAFAGVAPASKFLRKSTIDSLPPPDQAKAKARDRGIEQLYADAQIMEVPVEILMAQGVTICSVHSAALYSRPQWHGGLRRIYKMDAADPDTGYATLTIFNTFQNILDTSLSEEEITSNGHLGYTPKPVPARAYAPNLVQEWAGDHWANSEGGNIGVMIIASQTPTQDELARLRDLRTKFCRTLINMADAQWGAGKRNMNFGEARNAMEWLGTEDAENHPWYSMLEHRTFIPVGCPACSAKVPTTAFVCPDCHTNLAEYYLRRNRPVDRATMPAIFEEIAFLQQEKAKASPAPAPNAP